MAKDKDKKDDKKDKDKKSTTTTTTTRQGGGVVPTSPPPKESKDKNKDKDKGKKDDNKKKDDKGRKNLPAGTGLIATLDAAYAAKTGKKNKDLAGFQLGNKSSKELKGKTNASMPKDKKDKDKGTKTPAAAVPTPAARPVQPAGSPSTVPRAPYVPRTPTTPVTPATRVDNGAVQGAARAAATPFRGSRQTAGGGGNAAAGGEQGITQVGTTLTGTSAGQAQNRKGTNRLRFI